jgi:putative ABC transport system permease protein
VRCANVSGPASSCPCSAGLAVLGALIGTAGALALVHLLSGLLYGVSLTDPRTFVLVPTLLLAAAVLAGAVPARRAAHIDPLEALRAE